MIRVGILGATGYAALELIKILLRHPQVKFAVLTSRQEGSPCISSIHPQLTGRLALAVSSSAPVDVAEQCDCVFSCLPHAASAASVAEILTHDTRVVDFSADYRLRDLESYRQWYGEHPDPDRIGHVVYGLPELFRKQIPSSNLVANPGCYTSTSILALSPLICGNQIEPQGIIIDAKSGVSGAGRTLKLATQFAECNESVSAYAVGKHRHRPEIEQILSLAGNQEVRVVFTPHLVPMYRGILCTIYARPTSDISEQACLSVMRDYYAESPFVRIVEHLPSTKDVSGTNFCDITVRRTGDQLILISCTDNLIKGAAGVAVQNFNLMFGFDETTALI